MYIGIDLGTSSVKILVVRDNGEIVNEVTKDYPIFFPQPNWAEQDPEMWYNAVILGIKEAIQDKGSEVKGIGLSGQMHGLVILDENDILIRPAILWNDQRTHKQCEILNSISNINEYTGNMVLTGFTAPKVLWVKENEPDNFKRIRKIMLPKDYIAYKLTKVFATDVSDSSGTLYFDVKNKLWSKEMLDILSISEEQLPKVFESYESIGTIDKSVAEETGLNPQTVVIIGGGDQAVGAVGTGTVCKNSCSISLGTSGVVFLSLDKFIMDNKLQLHSFCHANGRYHLMGVILNAASCLKWWLDVCKTDNLQELIDEAERVSPSEQLYFLPYLMGERTPINDHKARGGFVGLHLSHERKHLTRAIMEGVAFALRDSYEIIKSVGVDIKKIRVTGGGAKSILWLQLIADILNVDVETLQTEQGPAYGAAILAMVGCNEFSNVEEACNKLIVINGLIKPNHAYFEMYSEKYRRFKELYISLKKLFSELND